MDYTVHGILQARILDWVDMPFSRGSSQPQESNPGLPHCRRIAMGPANTKTEARVWWGVNEMVPETMRTDREETVFSPESWRCCLNHPDPRLLEEETGRGGRTLSSGLHALSPLPHRCPAPYTLPPMGSSL